MNKITVSAPGKLMIMGEHAVLHGQPCIVTAVGQRMRLTVESISEPFFLLEAKDVNVSDYRKSMTEIGRGDVPKGARFIEIALRNFMEKYSIDGGLRIETMSEFASTFGFGSSSASTVCLIKSLFSLFDIKHSSKDIFDLAFQTVLDVQGKGSGFDIAAAVYGGTILYSVKDGMIKGLSDSLPLVIGYSGVKADTVTLIDAVSKKSERFGNFAKEYREIGKLVEGAATCFPLDKWENDQQLGELMNMNQAYLDILGVNTSKLSAMIWAARDAGAYGAKLSGAGGGDCMIALVPEDKRSSVMKAIEDVGGQVIDIPNSVEGARIDTASLPK